MMVKIAVIDPSPAKSVPDIDVQTAKPDLSYRHEGWDGVYVIVLQLPVRPITAEKRSSHCFDPLGRAFIIRKRPRKDGQVIGSITPPAAIEIEDRKGPFFFTGIPA